jgi:hypothetical protein
MSFNLHSKPFSYQPASAEEVAFQRVLMGAILEFGEPHDLESGAMTRPFLSDKKGRQIVSPTPKATGALEYYMLQEDGLGFSVFGAMRTTYTQTTPAEPVRLTVQFVTVRGTAVIDVSVPSRYAAADPARERAYDEKLGPHAHVGILTRVKGVQLEDILLAFAANKNVPAEDFASLLAVMREQGETKTTAPLTPTHLTLLTEFITTHFGDFSKKVPPYDTLNFEEIIPESPAEVVRSDGWIRGVGEAAETARQDKSKDKPA